MAAKPVARLTDVHVCPLHAVNAIVTGAETILINNLPMARVGDTTACGATIVTGVTTVFGENILTAHIGSETSHGGIIATGSHDTFVDDGTGNGAGVGGGTGGAASETTSLLNVIKEYLGSVLSGEKLEESLAQFDKYLDVDMDLETTRQMIDEFAVFGGVGKLGKIKPKPVNLPSWKKINIDMEHIASGHMKGGSRVSPQKSLFPENMTTSQVKEAVQQAYKNGKRIKTQGDRVVVQGNNIEMWVNTKTKIIESAYPFK